MDLPQNHLFLSLEIFFIKVFYEGFDCLDGPLAPSSTDTDLVMRLKMFSHRGRCFEQIRLKNENRTCHQNISSYQQMLWYSQ